jgi:hypothetical protein
MTPEVREDIPWADTLTDYDNAHFTIYLQLLNASADHATDDEMARLVLGIDPSQEPERARKTLRSHLDRANWLMTSGYKELFAR